MNNVFFIIVIITIFIVTYFSGRFLESSGITSEQVVQIKSPKCNLAISSCITEFGDGEIVIRFLQQPSALTPFDVEVLTHGFDATSVNIVFVMNGMDMGSNAYNLDQQLTGIWRVKVILPVCSLGRNDWIAEIRIKSNDKILRLDLPF